MISITRDARKPEWASLYWFNLGAPMIKVHGLTQGAILVWLWDCFNRRTADGDHFWGVGLLNINGRHLLYAGHEKLDVLFVRLWRR